MKYTWIPFYKEFAEKLINYRNDRTSLLSLIYKNKEVLLAKYLHDNKGEDDLLTDVDPFTVFGLFNRGIKPANRINSVNLFKKLFNMKSDTLTDFEGIPTLNNQRSYFFGYRDRREKYDIENLWLLFEKVVKGEDIEDIFNVVIKQYGININITMALFWICPNDFLAFDSTNRAYLHQKYDIDIPNSVPQYKQYMKIVNEIKDKMEAGTIHEKSFVELSSNADKKGMGENKNKKDSQYNFYVNLWRKRQNLVLQGAPGTGKTYRVPELVVRLCSPDFDAENATREELMAEYNQLKSDRRVMFTTFHQSMDYEDWLEGLRPVVENNQVTYEIEPGIFKKLCDEADKPLSTKKDIEISDDTTIWKVSLCGTGDNPVRKDCMKNGYIRIGWDGYGENITEQTDWSIHNGEGRNILNAFMNTMKIGDVVMSCYSSRTIDAIGIVTGDYEWHDEFDDYKRLRKVKWLVKGLKEDIVSLNDGKTMTLGTIYRLNAMSLDKVKMLLDKYEVSKTLKENTKPYVIVIDEMNRGNVAKIFGELITLLETDKRKGRKNAESVILPYSKKPFYIPSNVYLIATMNTADRSLGTIDYAVRRRFAFVTVRPIELEEEHFNTELFRKVSELFVANYDEYVESKSCDKTKLIPAVTLCEEYKAEDVWIGHSYFIMEDDNEVKNRLKFEIIPLLEEYVRDGILTNEAQDRIDELNHILTSE
ncbi:MAG: AAA family ATPase [Bacteroides sp.]|nr:AAA family ATPase [Roseburia sp.]MCM1346276.1 AAA family ATPase [Bacteroides sp.]MCM1420884.1 AAA family ATPase [Bacteroides sp.]